MWPRTSTRFFVCIASLSAALLFFLVGCEPSDPPEPAAEQEAPDFLVAHMLDADGQPVFADDEARFEDMSHAMHGTSMVGGLSRGSEMGHPNYNEGLAGPPQAERGRDWLASVSILERFFSEGGRLHARVDAQTGRPMEEREAAASADLRLYSPATYAYHIHHRGDRWADHGLEDAITYNNTTYYSDMGRYLLDAHTDNGRIAHDADHEQVDLESMSHGGAALHSHVYAWVRWHKPGGADDMGQLAEEHLAQWLHYTPDDLVEEARQQAAVWDSWWDDELEAYHDGAGPEGAVTMDLATLGALLHAHKSWYETLHIFGTDSDREQARQLFERSADMLDAALDLAEPWGMPAAIRFEDGTAHVASDTMSTQALWTFVNHLTGGFSYAREREGTAQYITTHRPELMDAINAFTDQQLQGALDYQMHNGQLVTALDMETGEVADDTVRAAPIGIFLTAAGNAYSNGTAFAPASDWDHVGEEVAARSETLYDALLVHAELLEDTFRMPAAD